MIRCNNLTNNSVSGTDTQVACGSYTWIDGNTYNNKSTTIRKLMDVILVTLI